MYGSESLAAEIGAEVELVRYNRNEYSQVDVSLKKGRKNAEHRTKCKLQWLLASKDAIRHFISTFRISV